MAGSNRFSLLASVDESDFEPQPVVVETVSAPTLNSSADEPEHSFHDFQPVPKKEKKVKQRDPNAIPSQAIGAPPPLQLDLPGPPERFSIYVDNGDKLSIPKSKSDKWTSKKAVEMKEHKAESKARKAEKANEHKAQSKNAQWRRERAADMKARKVEAKARRDAVKNNI